MRRAGRGPSSPRMMNQMCSPGIRPGPSPRPVSIFGQKAGRRHGQGDRPPISKGAGAELADGPTRWKRPCVEAKFEFGVRPYRLDAQGISGHQALAEGKARQGADAAGSLAGPTSYSMPACKSAASNPLGNTSAA